MYYNMDELWNIMLIEKSQRQKLYDSIYYIHTARTGKYLWLGNHRRKMGHVIYTQTYTLHQSGTWLLMEDHNINCFHLRTALSVVEMVSVWTVRNLYVVYIYLYLNIFKVDIWQLKLKSTFCLLTVNSLYWKRIIIKMYFFWDLYKNTLTNSMHFLFWDQISDNCIHMVSKHHIS